MQAEELAYRARALAQSHPLTDAATAFRAYHVALERDRQAMAQFAEWAAVAFLSGYCVRRVEESACDVVPSIAEGDSIDRAAEVAAALRAGEPVTLLNDAVVIEALDRVITSEIAKRSDQWREQVGEAEWSEFETYAAWWVTFGYAARAAETGIVARSSMPPPATMRILVVGVGNMLQGDDGFGVELARRLAERPQPDGVKIDEIGIGGIALVQELMAGYDACIVLDAVDRGRPPGTVMVIEPDVIDVHDFTPDVRHDMLADMHLATPSRALMVARAVGVLPKRTVMVGCQPAEIERLEIGLSPAVAAAVEHAIAEVDRCIAQFQAEFQAEFQVGQQVGQQG